MLAGQTLYYCPARHTNYLTASISYCGVAVSPHEFWTVEAVWVSKHKWAYTQFWAPCHSAIVVWRITSFRCLIWGLTVENRACSCIKADFNLTKRAHLNTWFWHEKRGDFWECVWIWILRRIFNALILPGMFSLVWHAVLWKLFHKVTICFLFGLCSFSPRPSPPFSIPFRRKSRRNHCPVLPPSVVS